MKVSNGNDFKLAREALGFTKVDCARIMRLPRPRVTGYQTIARWETAAVKIPGPACILMEALLSGWRPKYLRIKAHVPA